MADPARRSDGRVRGLLAIAVPALVAGVAVVLLTGAGEPSPAVPQSWAVTGGGLGPSGGGATEPAKHARPARRPGRHRRPPAPRLLRIRDAGIAVPVQRVGAEGGELEVPPVDRVGWVRTGPRPGEPGRAVLIGHRDSQAGPAPFAGLAGLAEGTRIEVLAGGSARRYRVSGIQQVPKSDFPAARVYAPTRRSRLALITCEGAFEEGSYLDNLIVYAREVRPRRA